MRTQLAVRFGGLRVAFAAQAALELDEPERTGRLTARGADRQGGTRVRSEATFRVHGGENAAHVAIGGEVSLSGKLAPVIDAGAGVVIARMTREFAAALSERCAALELPAVTSAPDARPHAPVAPPPAAPPYIAPAGRPGLLARLRAWWHARPRRALP